jgi:hypothetical protein
MGDENEELMEGSNNGNISEEDQQEFAKFLAQLLQAKSMEDLQTKIQTQMKKDPKFMKTAWTAYQDYKAKKEQGSSAAIARLGMKLNYINKLNGKCPQGYNVFKKGGCIKCKKQKNKGIANIKAQLKTKNIFGSNQDDSRGSFMKNGIQ